MLIRVDLPAPFSPTMPVMAPLAMASDTPRTACTLPNDFWMPESSIAGAAITASTNSDFPAFPVFPAESLVVSVFADPQPVGGRMASCRHDGLRE